MGSVSFSPSLDCQKALFFMLCLSVVVLMCSGEVFVSVSSLIFATTPIERLSKKAMLTLLLSLGRRDLILTPTKLQIFRLSQYEKIIYLDADTLVLRQLSHLFDLPVPFAAAPDIGWPDCFNSGEPVFLRSLRHSPYLTRFFSPSLPTGVMVLTPSDETFRRLMAMSAERGSWDGGDQGLLNDFYGSGTQGGESWHRLSYIYNVTPSAYYQ
jgi:glycogenin glucosyltransferase